MKLWQTIRETTSRAAHEIIRARRNGVILAAKGKFQELRFGPWPRRATHPELAVGRWWHGNRPGDCCWLYFFQPRGLDAYLSLTYVVSTRGASYGTFRRAAQVLDYIAEIKRVDAIVCEAANSRISDRLLARWGWERHLPHLSRRHFIKRFSPAAAPQHAELIEA